MIGLLRKALYLPSYFHTVSQRQDDALLYKIKYKLALFPWYDRLDTIQPSSSYVFFQSSSSSGLARFDVTVDGVTGHRALFAASRPSTRRIARNAIAAGTAFPIALAGALPGSSAAAVATV